MLQSAKSIRVKQTHRQRAESACTQQFLGQNAFGDDITAIDGVWMPSAIFHIGTEKTGSSSIQHALQRNRQRLRQQGIAIPTFGETLNHAKFAVFAAREDLRSDLAESDSFNNPSSFWSFRLRSNLRERYGVHDDPSLQNFRLAFSRELETEIKGFSPSTKLAIFSTEFARSVLTSIREVQQLKALLGSYFGEIKILVYLRRQDELAVSVYSNRMREGSTGREILPSVAPTDPYYNYEKLLDRWSGVFGADRIEPRIYSEPELPAGNVVADFLLRCGIGDLTSLYLPDPVNEAIMGHAQEFLRQMNEGRREFPRPGTNAASSSGG